MKKPIIIIITSIFIITGLIAGGTYYFVKNRSSDKNYARNKRDSIPCLRDNETATLNIIGNRTTASSADIIIKDKYTGEEVFRFRIDGLVPNHYHPYEFHKCGVYVIRQFDYDVKTRRATPNYKIELWKYDYRDNGENVLLFSETDDKGNYTSYFNDDFRIDPQEIYVALERGYPDTKDYALVIKNFNLKVDDFLLLRKDLAEKYPGFTGLFGLRAWTKDGSYFWGDLFVTSIVEAFLRIARTTWQVNVLLAPEGTMGGTALNSDFGYITYDDGPPWTGDADFSKMYKEEWEREGKKVHFYLYNFFTKEQILLTTIDDPLWSFKPEWISDTELQYELPNGEKKVYKIEKN